MEKNLTLSVSEIKDHVQLIQKVMTAVMKKDEHYGKIPGTHKDTLFQTGAQKLLATFKLGSEPEVIYTDETEFSVSYRVKVRLFSIVDGKTVGYGIGECSSSEEKFAWKKAVNEAEFKSYNEKRRRIKHYAAYAQKQAYSVRQIATNHKDVSNTVLKMATKRALVGGVLTVTAAGDIFTQDLEDMEPQTRDSIVSASNNVASSLSTQIKSNASLQDIRDAVILLGNKTFMEDKDGKKILLVAGNCWNVKDNLAQMGFLYRKENGAQYGETYMDVTHLVEKSNPTNTSSTQIDTTYESLENSVSELGLALDIVKIDGKDFAEVIGDKIYENREKLKSLGFKFSNDDSKSWRFDMNNIKIQSEKLINSLSIDELTSKAEVLGFNLSKPEPDNNGNSWVKAIPLDEHCDYINLKETLGFKHLEQKNIHVLKLSA